MYLSSIDNVILHLVISPDYSYGYKDKTYSLVTSFVPVLVVLVYNVYTIIYDRTG